MNEKKKKSKEQKTEPALRRRGKRRAEPWGRRGQAARWRRAHPLGSTCAGEGAGDGAMLAPPPARSLSHSRSLLDALRKKERRERGVESGEEREAERPNDLGFLGGGRGYGFVRAKSTRSRRIDMNDRD